MNINKSLLFAIAAGTFTIAIIPTVLMWRSLNDVQTQLQTAQPSTVMPPATPATPSSQASSTDPVEAERLAQEAEARRQAAAEQKAREDLVHYTATTWQNLIRIMSQVGSMSDDGESSTAMLTYALTELDALPIDQADPKLAVLVQDVYRLFDDAGQLDQNYQRRMEDLGVDILEAGQLGCDVAAESVEENQLGWCLGAGLLTGTLMAAGASEEVKQLEAEYEARSAALTAEMESLGDRFATMTTYLAETYGITAN